MKIFDKKIEFPISKVIDLAFAKLVDDIEKQLDNQDGNHKTDSE